MDRQTGRQTDELVEGGKDEPKNKWVDRQTERLKAGQLTLPFLTYLTYSNGVPNEVSFHV